jgi:hypothetical protein
MAQTFESVADWAKMMEKIGDSMPMPNLDGVPVQYIPVVVNMFTCFKQAVLQGTAGVRFILGVDSLILYRSELIKSAERNGLVAESFLVNKAELLRGLHGVKEVFPQAELYDAIVDLVHRYSELLGIAIRAPNSKRSMHDVLVLFAAIEERPISLH